MSGNSNPVPAPAAAKSKRTRTGCLTCRKRHLKCDEALPACQNCVKSKKYCERGIRLNFLDLTVQHPYIIPPGADWHVSFFDESRDIASEYEGGIDLYPPPSTNKQHKIGALRRQSQIDPRLPPQFQYLPPSSIPQPIMIPPPAPSTHPPPAPSMHHSELPSAHDTVQNNSFANHRPPPEIARVHDPYAHSAPQSAVDPPQSQYMAHQEPSQPQSAMTLGYETNDLDDKRELLADAQEVLYMQVFCEEVGIWMDSMDPMKHFSRLLPFHSLSEPMLRNAFLACGARHLTLVNPIYTEERALLHYDTATRHLLKNLQDPDRDTVVCATTAVILNVYEIMCERALPRMNHIAGARALIKECGWDARAVGVGSACFWLNVGLEVLSCLHFKWQAAWDPDDWGIDMDWTREIHNGREEIWTHRMLYIVAKVSNFRATVPKKELPDPNEERARKQARYKEWRNLNELADSWNNRIPRTMHPMAYIFPERTSSKSAFPEVWLIKRTTIVARLFYHTVMVLLAQTNPLQSRSDPEMWDMERRHSQMICGISAHVKDRGVASVALRSLAHAAECLTERHEQQEVLDIFTKINRETGWRIAFVFKELKALWGWKDDPSVPTPHITSNSDPTPRPVVAEHHKPTSLSYPTGFTNNESLSPHSTHSSAMSATLHNGYNQPSGLGHSVKTPTPGVSPTTPGRAKMPSGIKNPLFANADFSMPQHPYQNVYVAPNIQQGQPQMHQLPQYHAQTGLYY